MSYATNTVGLQSFTILQIADVDSTGPITDSVTPYCVVEADHLVQLLRISDHNLRKQVEDISMQIGWWSRIESQAQRTVEYLERRYAIWKGQQRALMPVVWREQNPEAKKPTKEQIEDLYRALPEYSAINHLIEVAKDAHRSCSGLVAGLKSKAKRLDVEVYRVADGTLQRRTV